MIKIPFFLDAEKWEGEGSVYFPFAFLELFFKVNWTITYVNNKYECEQIVHMLETNEKVHSYLTFNMGSDASHQVIFNHEEFGEIEGEIKVGATTFSWTFEKLEGHEIYEMTGPETCRFQARYGKEEMFRREIKGILRKKL